MKKEKLSEAISNIDDRHVNEALAFQGKKRPHARTKFIALAACLCLAVAMMFAVLPMLRGDDKDEDTTSQATQDDTTAQQQPLPSIPIYENAYLTVDEVSSVFPVADGFTSAYTKIYRPESRPLDLSPLPTEEYAKIYKINRLSKDLSNAELNEFADNIIPKLTEALGVSISSFEKKDYEYIDEIEISYEQNKLRLYFYQISGNDDYGITFSSNRVWLPNLNQLPLVLNGKEVSVDQRQSEEEIIESLVWVRDILFDIFACSFDNVKVEFSYNSTNEHGVSGIRIYYYNNDHDGIQMNDYRYMGDYICLHFDNHHFGASDLRSNDILNDCSISYKDYRIPLSDYYTAEAECKLISLDDAEALLANGYVFGGHVCSICMSQQEKVSFDDYDHVGFEYVQDLYSETPRAVPFYTFYKKIGVAQNGNIIYAKTYVCAIEVSGYEEYFEEQEKNHQNNFVAVETLPE